MSVLPHKQWVALKTNTNSLYLNQYAEDIMFPRGVSFSSHGGPGPASSSSDCLKKTAGEGNIHQTQEEPKAGGEVFFIIFAFGKQSISLVTVLKKKKGKGREGFY